MTDFRPGHPLPSLEIDAKERQLYHAQRGSGAWATMQREEGSWQWRQLHGGGEAGYGRGSWREMQAWLKEVPHA
ncbi:hypothetical protein [Deinococcus sp. NW-56]|uniref:hypothetical protein n=1 Tax=Deinococcus sp. NW-56 TaxID=2080419 RepID=UPI000CF4C6E0|nr:hypothetical protein [Deinococcus sp. NW-56]